MNEKSFFVYMLASKKHGTIYTGMTANLPKRVWEHKNKVVEGFTKDHGVDRLVYFENHDSFEAAAMREKRLKAWKRNWKINLIEERNPDWNDLYEKLF